MADSTIIEDLAKAVEHLHDCSTAFASIEHVSETFRGQPVWEGDVYVFDLEGHALAETCYAWVETLEDGRPRYFAVLHAGPVASAQDAVRASIVSDYKDAHPGE